LGVSVTGDVATHEQKYKVLSKNLRVQLDTLLNEIRKMKSSNPAMKGQVEVI
jgi:hypothetical protein